MVRPFVKIALKQYKEQNTLRGEKKESLSKLIREALSSFTKKKEHSISISASHLPREARENYRRVTTYLSRSDLSLLASISKETGRCKTHLIREAVDNYLGSTVIRRPKRNLPDNHAD